MSKRKKRDSAFWESSALNNATYQQYYNRLSELSMVMFEWKNLPPTIDERFLELVLFRDGRAVIFEDEAIGMVVMRVNANGPFDLYNIPKERKAYAINGYHNSDLNENNSVLIFNNYMHTNSMLDVEMFSRRLYEIDRTIDVNIKAQKTPILIQCTEQQRLTMENLYKKYDGNVPFIFGDSSLDISGIKVLTTNAPFVVDKLRQEKNSLWNEALTYLGISNTNITKRERLISDEVIRSQGGVIASRYSRLQMRRQACLKLRELFPETMGQVWCDYRDDFREVEGGTINRGGSADNTNADIVNSEKEGV